MAPDTGNTTAPVDPSERTSPRPGGASALAFVVCHCVPEPHRAGQVALFDPRARRPFVIGRAGVSFCEQRPRGMVDRGRLKGETISSEQLLVTCEGDGLRLHNVGRAAVFVDGARLPKDTSVHAREGTAVEVFGHTVFLVTRRPLSMPEAHPLLLPLHVFGGPDAMGFVGESPRIWLLRQAIVLAASRGVHVLVFGQTGSGKDLVSEAIHAKSVRAGGPFVRVNCATLRHELSALQLFGGRKGWPNPGTLATVGYFNAAAGGTLFLDEIGEMAHALQNDLLNALERGYAIAPETHLTPTRCVVVAATNRGELGLKDDVRHRFGTVIETPALEERREDIGLLVPWLLSKRAQKEKEFAAKFQRTDATERSWVPVEGSLVASLLRYPLRGNVRELENLLGKAGDEAPDGQPIRWPATVPEPPAAQLEIRREDPHVTAEEVVRGLDAPRAPTMAPPVVVVREAPVPSADRPDPSKERVVEALQLTKYNYVKAAAMLEISVDKLFRLRKKYGLH